VKYLHVGLVLS